MTAVVFVCPIMGCAIVCSGKAPQGPTKLFPCQAPMAAHCLAVTAPDVRSQRAQPGGWMFSALLGASRDSCLRQNPDRRAWSIKLPITLP